MQDAGLSKNHTSNQQTDNKKKSKSGRINVSTETNEAVGFEKRKYLEATFAMRLFAIKSQIRGTKTDVCVNK